VDVTFFEYLRALITADPLQALFLGGESGKPFAALHALAE